jgi:hypothetical protein
MDELDDRQATELIKRIVATGAVSFSVHGLAKCQERDIRASDLVSVLRAGWVARHEEVNGSWRYHVCTQKFTVIVAFRSTAELVVITAWRFQ